MSDEAQGIKAMLYRVKKLAEAEEKAAAEFHADKSLPKDYLKNKNEPKRKRKKKDV